MPARQRCRRRNPGAPLRRILWWDGFCKPLSWTALATLYGHRWWGVDRIPPRGPVLLICNHQSYLDLPVLGCGIHHRHFHSMARSTLFKNPLFDRLIRSLNAFPVEQGKGDIKSVRAAIERLNAGHLVLVFPEGGRTPDGRLQPFNPGTMLLIRRARPAIVPMAVDGVFDIWKIGQPLPRLRGRTGASYGDPIAAQTLLDMKPDDALALLQRRVETLRLDTRRRLRRLTHGAWPPPGPGDEPNVAPDPANAAPQPPATGSD